MSLNVRRGWMICALLAAVALGAWLRLVHIGGESLDNDEVWTRIVVTHPLPEAMADIRQDLVHPPLFYLMQMAVLWLERAGNPPSDLALRSLSVAVGLLTLLAVGLLGWLVRPLLPAALVTVFLLALNPWQIQFSEEARSYGMTCLMVALLMLWAVLLAHFRHRFAYWAAGAVLMTAYFYIHFFAAFYCLAIVLPMVIFARSWRLRGQIAATYACACVLFLPCVLWFAPSYKAKSGLQTNLSWNHPPRPMEVFAVTGDYLALPWHGAVLIALVIAAIGVVVFGLLDQRSAEARPLSRQLRTLLGMVAFLPPLIVLALSEPPLKMPIYGERYFLPSGIAFLLLFCYAAWRLTLRLSAALRLPVFAAAALLLAGLQVQALRAQGDTPFRIHYAGIAQQVGLYPDLPVYAFPARLHVTPPIAYLLPNRPILFLPRDSSQLPARYILLVWMNAGAVMPIDQDRRPLLHNAVEGYRVVDEKDFFALDRRSGMRLLVMQRTP